jgi:transposase, IS30 family
MGSGDQHCIVTLVERKSGYTLVGKLKARTKEEAARRTTWLIGQHAHLFRTITADNGTEFHSYADIEAATGVKFYFATPHHSWGARNERKHKRADPAVPAKAREHEGRNTATMQCHR